MAPPDPSRGPQERDRFDRLFEAHFRDVLAYAVRRVDEPADGADVAAETFLVAWRRLGDVPAGEEARLWLFGAARRVLANQRRGVRRRDALADRLREEVVEAVCRDEDADATAAVVRQAMATLRPDDREILALTSWEGLDPHEAAVVMGISAATARTRLRRARARLRSALVALGWEDPSRPAPAVLHVRPAAKEVSR